MTTRQTPDAVREVVDPRVEIGAKALGLHRIPGGNGPPNSPTRWPTGPQDTLSGRDGTVPLTWDFAEQCRSEVRAILAALDSRAGEAWRCERRVRIQEALQAALGDAYDCTRVWSAWGYGTMDEHDFVPVLDRLEELVDEIDASIFSATPAPAVDAKARADMAAALRNTPAEALREAGYLERAAKMIEAPAVDAVPAGEVERLRSALREIAAYPSSTRITSDMHCDRETLINIARIALSHGEGRK